MNTDTHCMGMNVKVHEMQNKDQVPQENPKYLPLTHTHTHTHTHTITILVPEFGAFDIEKYHLCSQKSQ